MNGYLNEKIKEDINKLAMNKHKEIMNKHKEIMNKHKIAMRKFCCVPDMILCMSTKKYALKALAYIYDRRHSNKTLNKKET